MHVQPEMHRLVQKLHNCDRPQCCRRGIYTHEEYTQLIAKASNTGRFKVHKVKTHEILDFKKWWPGHYKKSVSASDKTLGRDVRKESKVPFKISTYRQFEFSSLTKGKVVVREFINGLRQSTFSLLKAKQPPELPTQKDRHPIQKAKLNDLIKLTEYTTGYEDFYNALLQWPTTDAEQIEGLNQEED